MNTGFVVVGTTPGGYLIEDLGIRVPHQVAVTITPEQVVKSKDLYRAINQQRIFKLDGIVGLAPTRIEPPSVVPNEEVSRLKEELDQSAAKNNALTQSLQDMQQKLDAILGFLAMQPQQGGTAISERRGPPSESKTSSDVAVAFVPVFIPDTIKPEGAEMSIEEKTDVSEGGGVDVAASRLRELRRR